MKPSDPDKVVSRETVVPSPPGAIFDLLADPRRHCEIDGSGSVRQSEIDAPERLSLGARFGMKMRIVVPYRITNEVVEFEEGRLIAWRHFNGHRWRYRLEPVDATATLVTETFDGSTARFPPALLLINAYANNQTAVLKTLVRLKELVESRQAGAADGSS